MMATLEFNKLQSFYNINKKVLHFLRFSLNITNHQSEKEKARQVTAANFWNVQKKLTVPNTFFVNFQWIIKTATNLQTFESVEREQEQYK